MSICPSCLIDSWQVWYRVLKSGIAHPEMAWGLRENDEEMEMISMVLHSITTRSQIGQSIIKNKRIKDGHSVTTSPISRGKKKDGSSCIFVLFFFHWFGSSNERAWGEKCSVSWAFIFLLGLQVPRSFSHAFASIGFELQQRHVTSSRTRKLTPKETKGHKDLRHFVLGSTI